MKRFFVFLTLTMLLFSAEKSVGDYTGEDNECTLEHYMGKRVIGETEWVGMPKQKLHLRARIDTGATTTSIDARAIRVQNRDGRKWAIFELIDRESGRKIELERPIVRIVPIKRHGMKDQERPVVKLHLRIGVYEKYTEVSLTDRSKYDYPVLIGRNFLRNAFVVDVSRAYIFKDANTTEEK